LGAGTISRFPEIPGNSIRDTCAFQGFRDFGNPEIKNLFSNPLCAAILDFRNEGREFQEISGTLLHMSKFPENFGKGIQICTLFFRVLFVFPCTALRKKVKNPKTQMTLWGICTLFPKFFPVFSGFSGLNLESG
jgi:hypothetical protein